MSFRKGTLPLAAAVGLFAVACGEPDEVGSATNDVTVTPTGSSTLGAFEALVPEAVAPGGSRTLLLELTPEGATTSSLSTLLDAEKLAQKTPVRVVPGTYCVRVHSRENLSELVTRECGIAIVGGKTTTYALATLTVTADAAAFVRSQSAMGFSTALRVSGPHVVSSDVLDGRIFASTAGTFTSEILSSGATWTPATTVLPRGGAVDLAVPREDKVVRIEVSSERGTLPGAVEGGGLRWRWPGAPAELSGLRDWTALAAAQTLLFFAQDSTVVFEVGGVEQKVSLAQPRKVTQFARRLEVTDVTETDNAGVVTKLPGRVLVTHPTAGTLQWRDAQNRVTSSFPTNQSVLVWAGTYDVKVFYVANGVSKTYDESVRVP